MIPGISIAWASTTGVAPGYRDAGTWVVAGGGDQATQAVGVGAVQEGIIALTLGTRGVVFATTGGAFIESEGRRHAFCHAVPGKWRLMGVMLSAGGSLRFSQGEPWDDITEVCDDCGAKLDGNSQASIMHFPWDADIS